ncbi:MAG: ATP-binding protein [Treponema sp.]|jgi:hypothetical protein|nr:ATP-binding protein [Treponema sp.]
MSKVKPDKTLVLDIQSLIIRHLGIQMYQKPADVISEMVANAWDADAEKVNIKITKNSIGINDDGHGMTFDECQKYFLKVGRDRRKDTRSDKSIGKKRPVLGRKGIGKFAGFGIANKITIDTISLKNGENTVFCMDLDKIYEIDQSGNSKKEIDVIKYSDPDEKLTKKHGTKVTLFLKSQFAIDEKKLLTELGRRFLLTQQHSDFSVSINKKPMPVEFGQDFEFYFPKELTQEEKKKFPDLKSIENEWAKEKFRDNYIYWRIGFFKDTIKNEELRGIAIFVRGKLAQKPFFFDLSGGISGQNSLEYLSGQVKIDFIDSDDLDLISTERQRINIQDGIGLEIKDWGQELIRQLGAIWKERRATERLQKLESKVGKFKKRLDNLPPAERKTVKSVLIKIANIESLKPDLFEDWCSDILTSWETGRLKGLIEEISQHDSINAEKMLEILSEAQVLTSLNIAESIKTKVVAIAELKKMVDAQELENSIRDYIYKNPWLIHPKWDSYKKEISVKHIIDEIGKNELDKDDVFKGRIDLALSAGPDLLLLEFMRPGLEIDQDHLNRIEYYVDGVRQGIEQSTGKTIRSLTCAYIIADKCKKNSTVNRKISRMVKEYSIYVLSWNDLIAEAIKQWEEQLDILKQNNRADPRIQAL